MPTPGIRHSQAELIAIARNVIAELEQAPVTLNPDIEELLKKFCNLSIEVACRRFDFPAVASDCFCAEASPARVSTNWHFEHNPSIIEYIRDAVRAALDNDPFARKLTEREVERFG